MAEASKYPDSDFSDEEQTPLDISFSKAADRLRKITSKLNNDQLLELYAMYKQAMEGVCNMPKPGWFDARGRKKWEAWCALGNMPKEEAKRRYIELVHKYDPESEVQSSSENVGKENWVAVSSLLHSPEPDLDLSNLTIFEAAREDLGDQVAAMLAKDPELKNAQDEDGLTALHWAADRDATSALTAALKGGCSVDTKDESGQTALHYAALCGHIKSTKILLEHGASILKDDDGATPLDLAVDEEEILKALEGAI